MFHHRKHQRRGKMIHRLGTEARAGRLLKAEWPQKVKKTNAQSLFVCLLTFHATLYIVSTIPTLSLADVHQLYSRPAIWDVFGGKNIEEHLVKPPQRRPLPVRPPSCPGAR